MSNTIQTKQCSRCKQNKPFSNFSKHKNTKDGLQNYCKSCMSNYQRTPKGVESHRKGQKKYRQSPKGRNQRKRYLESPEGHIAMKKYRQSVKCHIAVARAIKKHNRTHPDRYQARMKIRSMFQTGKIPRAKELICVLCGKQAEEYHHHQGYDEKHQLVIIPVCKPCNIHIT